MEDSSEALYLFHPAQFLGKPSVIAPPETGKISVALQFIIPNLHISIAENEKYKKLIKNCLSEVWDSDLSIVRNKDGLQATLVTIAFYIEYLNGDVERHQAIGNTSRILIERFLGVVSYCAGIKLSGINIINTIIEGSNYKTILNMTSRAQSPKIEFSIPNDLIDGKIPSPEIFAALFWLRRGLAEGNPIDTYNAFTVCLQILARIWWERKMESDCVVEKPQPRRCPYCEKSLPLLDKCPSCDKDLPVDKIPPISGLFREYINKELEGDPALIKKVWSKRNAIVAHGNKLDINAEDLVGLTELKFEVANWAYKGINLALGFDLQKAPRPSQNFFATDALMNID